MTVDERLAEIDAREKAATAGEWCPCEEEDHCSAVTSNGTVISLALTTGTVHANARTRADGEFIARAREDVPWLLSLVRRQRAALVAVRKRLNHPDECAWFNDEDCDCCMALVDAALSEEA